MSRIFSTAAAALIAGRHDAQPGPRYKWIVLSNTTLSSLLATINSSIILISLPAIFRGIHIDPLAHGGEAGFFLWLVLSYQLVMTSLLVTLGRIADMIGRVRMYNLGFAIFTFASVLLTFAPGQGPDAAVEIIVLRMFQAVGGACLFANSAALLTDAFPPSERGLALGLNQATAFAGQVVGLVLGGLLAALDYRLVFFISVPVGVFGWIWSRIQLRELATIRRGHRVDVWGNLTFVLGLALLLIGVTFGQQPYAGRAMGWTNPTVLVALGLSVVAFLVFVRIELSVRDPMFRLELFGNRMFASANLAGLLFAIARGGLQFMLIIWLQGIWLPLHGVAYEQTPLWAGVSLMPMIAGIVVFAPISGLLSDRFGARLFATAGTCVGAAGFLALGLLPANFAYPVFAAVTFAMGAAQGLFGSPNSTSIMNSLPPEHRGSGSGMRSTFQLGGAALSQAVFFSLVITGLASRLPPALTSGLVASGVPFADAQAVAALPPNAALFAAFLGYNPMSQLLPPPVLSALPSSVASTVLGHAFFPMLIAPAFMNGLGLAFHVGAALCLVSALASLLRGRRYIYAAPDAGAVVERREREQQI